MTGSDPRVDAPDAIQQPDLDEVRRILLQHPCLLDAHCALQADPERPGHGQLMAWVVPEPTSLRVPAAGLCTLVTEDGEEFAGSLCDVSFDGLRLKTADVPPSVGARVQAVVESPALGNGLEGWLGEVAWTRGREVGMAFGANWNEREAIYRLIQDFADAGAPAHDAASASDAPSPGRNIGRRTRVSIDLPAAVTLPSGRKISLRTRDVSASGLGLEGYRGPDLVGQSLQIELRIHGGADHPLRAVVARQTADGLLGVELDARSDAATWLAEMVDLSIRTRAVGSRVLLGWLGEMLGADLPSVRFVVLDALPRDESGEVETSRLPRPFHA